MASRSSVISWDAVVDAVDYEVVVLDAGNNANPPFSHPILETTLTGVLTSIDAGTVFGAQPLGTYSLQVRAIASIPSQNSDYSVQQNVAYDPKLDTPINVVVT